MERNCFEFSTMPVNNPPHDPDLERARERQERA